MQSSLQDLALGGKETIPALAHGSQALQGWQCPQRDEPGHICSPFQTPLCSLRAPSWGCVLPAPALGVCLWLRLEQEGRQEAKLCCLLPRQRAGHSLPQKTALLPGCIRGKTDTSGENYYPKVFRSSFLRKLRLLAFAQSPSDRYVSLKGGGAPAAGLEDPRRRQIPPGLCRTRSGLRALLAELGTPGQGAARAFAGSSARAMQQTALKGCMEVNLPSPPPSLSTSQG